MNLEVSTVCKEYPQRGSVMRVFIGEKMIAILGRYNDQWVNMWNMQPCGSTAEEATSKVLFVLGYTKGENEQ